MTAPTSIRLPLLAIVACAAAAAAPAGASAAAGSGGVTLTLGGSGKAAKSLTDAGVKPGAIAPATKRGKRVTLPVQSIAVGRSATVALRGGVSFKVGKRVLKLRSARVALTARQATVSAKAGKRRVALFAAALTKGKAKLDRSKTTAELTGAKLALTPKGAKLLRDKLDVGGIAAGAIGKLGVAARPKSGGGNGGSGGGPGGGGPQTGPLGEEPPILARPAGAVNVSSASLTWRPRESWIQYIHTGNGTSVFGGATNGPLEVKSGDPEARVYSFGFPFANGWYEAATGKAAIYFQGGVGFRYSGHGINFSSSKPEIEINGGASRAIFTFNGAEDTKYDDERGVLVNLHPSPIQAPPDGTVTYTDVSATIPAETGASVFAGFYPANSDFGTLTVSFTTP
jgi:Htaa protein